MSEPKKVEIEIGSATIKGEAIVLPADAAALAASPPAAPPATVNTGGGAATQGNVVANRFTGHNDQSNYEDHRSGNVTFQNPDNAVLLTAIFSTKDQIADVSLKLDGLPERVRKLEVRIPLSNWFLLAIFIAVLVFAVVFLAIRMAG